VTFTTHSCFLFFFRKWSCPFWEMKFGIDVPNSHPPVFKKKWNDYNKLNNNNNSNNNNSNDNNNINILESPPLLSLFTILIIIIHSTVTSLFSQQIWSPQVLLVFTMGSGPLQAHPVGMDVLPIHWTLIFFLLIPPSSYQRCMF
jgi:hypothetical protein